MDQRLHGVTVMHRIAAYILGATISLSACVATDDLGDSDTSKNAVTVSDGTPDGIGLLALLNDPSTNFNVLDQDVPLDRRAAGNLIAHRDGGDGISGTSDDDLFNSIDEVDAVRWVGSASLSRLVVFARSHGFVPAGDELLGTFDGVPFTVAEAARAIVVVNEQPEGVLRSQVPLDTRAVRSILAARPIATMAELADLYFVGPAGMRRLKAYVQPIEPSDERARCRENSDCADGGRCTGTPSDSSTEWGLCFDPTPIAGDGNDCSEANPCGDGLVCAGLTMWDAGFCVPEWMSETFQNRVGKAIPQQTPTPIATQIIVNGQASVPMDVVVDLKLQHSDPSSLRISLFDPNGAEAVLWDGSRQSGPLPTRFVAFGEISRDDQVNGRWWLRVWNVGESGTGNLQGWDLFLTSRWD